jgi:NADH-quinone oxidoreductase subunit F
MAIKKVTVDDLKAIKERVPKEKAKFKFRALVCGDTGCHASGSHAVKDALVEQIAKHKLGNEIEVVLSGCNGFCSVGPLMAVFPGGIFYQKLVPGDMAELVESHFKNGKPVERLMYRDPVSGKVIAKVDEIPYFTQQTMKVMKNMGYINPESIDEYIAADGYFGLAKALLEMKPPEIVKEVRESGLRGRGGGGFPTGMKWEFCANSKGDMKYVLCNADEGDPGAFMDRSVMEATPHAVLEGMIVAAKAINSSQGYIYCRAEYPLAIKRLTLAIEQAKQYGLLGENILGSGLNFDIEIYQGAGAFVCGEETALMASIEGRRGMPRPRPPFPAISGLWKKPTILNNVETYANISMIMRDGGEKYAELGTESSKGTKVFAVTGKINNIGLVEVPMGKSIGEVIFDICGGIGSGKKFKAAQLGGPSGGCLPVEHLNTPVDYEAIVKAGAIMGSGGLIVMDEDTCMVDMARFFMDFCQDESCGKCTPCRVGTRRMLEILQRITRGQGQEGDIELLQDMAQSIKDAALCGLGQTAPNPVLSTIRYFRDEYEAHIRDHRCPAGVCGSLFQSTCQNACPVKMDIPEYIALVRAGRIDDAYQVLKATNPFPSVCGRVCGHPCQDKCRRQQLDDSLAIKDLKRFITDNAKKPAIERIPVTKAEKIAVVGAGPGGLTAALELKKRGYAVTVFEQLPEAGGMLMWGIPSYRLPREILRREIQDIIDTGVLLKVNTKVGRDISFEDLDQQFDGIYLGIGQQHSAKLGVAGEDAEGVIGAVEFLREHNLGQGPKIGKKVAVIGGGNSAIDAARTSIRLGADAVTIFYRRERKDMPALLEEIVAAEEEGVKVEYLVAPTKVVVKGGKVAGLELNRMKLGLFDSSGRKRPEAVAASEFVADVDTVIAAIGQAAELEFIPKSAGIQSSRSTITVNDKFKTTNAKVWAGGDVVTGPAMVIDAVAAGQAAAVEIDRALRAAKGEAATVLAELKIEIPYEVDAEIVAKPRAAMSELKPAERCKDFREVELGYTMELARSEACRCLRCDVK